MDNCFLCLSAVIENEGVCEYKIKCNNPSQLAQLEFSIRGKFAAENCGHYVKKWNSVEERINV